MPDEPDPPRKHYGFKEREFKRDNVSLPGAERMLTAKELAVLATSKCRPPSARPPAPAARPASSEDPNNVYDALATNRRASEQHGLNQVEVKHVPSRRKRDFWFVIVGGNLFIIGGVWLAGINPITVIFGLAGLIIFSLSVTWIMWQVMDRY